MTLFVSAAKNYVVLVNSKRPEEEQFFSSLVKLASLCFQSDVSADAGRLNLVIALSGGLDSVVLLTMASRWQQLAGGNVRAVYIDHQLQSQSGEWGEHCASLCKPLNVPFSVQKVSVDLQSGLSPEASARDARYLAFEHLIETDELLCTAHHADDQAETLLLQLFRGAGVKGLGGMPEYRRLGRGYLVRPLLSLSRDTLARYADDNQLLWREDPSNTDTRYDRNFVRHELIPVIASRWPGVSGSLTRTASHCRDAVSVVNDQAAFDLYGTGSETSSVLALEQLQSLSVVRCKNALRYWINNNGFLAPSQAQLEQILRDLIDADNESHGRISFGEAQIARYRHHLFIGTKGEFDPAPDFEYQWHNINEPLRIHEAGWTLDSASRPRLQRYAGQLLTVRNRRGGEKWQTVRHHVSVKNLLQERHVPPWQRSRLALVFCGDELIDICGPEFQLE